MIKNEKQFLKCVKKYEERRDILNKACDDIIITLQDEFVQRCKELEDEGIVDVMRPDGNYAVAMDKSIVVTTSENTEYCNYVELDKEFMIGSESDSFLYSELSTDEKTEFINILLDFINE